MVKKQIRTTETIICCLLAIYLLYRIPVVSQYISTILFIFPIALLLALLFFSGPMLQKAGGKFLLTSVLFLVLLILDEIFLEKNIVYLLWDLLLRYTPLVAGCFIIEHKLEKAARVFMALTLASYIVTCITTYAGLLEYPNASRDLASGTGVDVYGKLNIGGFSFIYSLVVTHPMFVYYFRRKGRPVLAGLVSFLFALCVIEARYTIGLGVFIVSFLCYVIPVNDSKKINKGIVWLGLLCLAAVFLLMPMILEFLAELELFESYSNNLLDISRMLQGEEVQQGNTVLRQQVYKLPWDAFLRHPIMGSMLADQGLSLRSSGGHSFLLDTMGKWGLIGISIVLATVFALFKWCKRLFAGSYALYYVGLSFILSLVVASLNSTFWFFELGMLIPLFAYSAIQDSQEKKSRHRFRIRLCWK